MPHRIRVDVALLLLFKQLFMVAVGFVYYGKNNLLVFC